MRTKLQSSESFLADKTGKVPRGFDAGHPRAQFLLCVALYATYEAPLSKVIHTAEFVDMCLDIFHRAHPISQWLGKYVTKG